MVNDWPIEHWKYGNSRLMSRQLQRRTLESDRFRNRRLYPFVLYRLIERRSGDTVYVGVVLSRDYPFQFVRHYTDDLKMPWHQHQLPPGSYCGPKSSWPYRHEAIETLSGFTYLEAVAAQQFWWEHYGGGCGRLPLQTQPLLRTEFILMRGKGCWEGYLKGFPNGWVPSV